MSAVIPDLLLWDQSFNSSCGGKMDCDSLYELGPPPDMILNIPPPPIPPFMEEFVARLAAEGIDIHAGSESTEEEPKCNLCQWAKGNGVGYVELPQKGPLIDDTWFLVIISSCVAATLLGIILAIAFLKYREGKLKPLSDLALAKKEKALGLERCETVLYPAPGLSLPSQHDPTRSGPRALWAGIKPIEENHYTVDHCQPVDQKRGRLDLLPQEHTYDYADFSVNYSTLAPTYKAPLDQSGGSVLGVSQGPAPAASFENVGYVAGDEAVEVEHVAPDGCVLTAPRAARLLGAPHHQQAPTTVAYQHHYEMVTPRSAHSSRRHRSLERNGGPPHRHAVPEISAPSSLHAVRLPPLNSRPDVAHGSFRVPHAAAAAAAAAASSNNKALNNSRGTPDNARYNLTALANGSHTLTPKVDNATRAERRQTHVSLDRSGSTSTSLAPPASPTDHIYASPITSPVI
ncbi:uncharacterized protein LOC143032841 [Oratosquilla oratoria]|uniref:uncharacterized protein LOC143032841 n=1 Tax=Oratosquilla oratoria TaxID=337810 RepID=UPI003F763FCB